MFNPTESEYWNFSWHEIGFYDLPAMIDHILSATNYTNIHYIGHSQGVTTFFVMITMKPEYNEKIVSMHAMSPVVYLRHPSIMLQMFGNNINELQVFQMI